MSIPDIPQPRYKHYAEEPRKSIGIVYREEDRATLSAWYLMQDLTLAADYGVSVRYNEKHKWYELTMPESATKFSTTLSSASNMLSDFWAGWRAHERFA